MEWLALVLAPVRLILLHSAFENHRECTLGRGREKKEGEHDRDTREVEEKRWTRDRGRDEIKKEERAARGTRRESANV